MSLDVLVSDHTLYKVASGLQKEEYVRGYPYPYTSLFQIGRSAKLHLACSRIMSEGTQYPPMFLDVLVSDRTLYKVASWMHLEE